MTIGKRWPLYLLLIVIGVLGTRLAWRVSVSETGWSPHLDQWAGVATSLVGVEHREIGDQDPAEQAKFWLSEVEKIGPANDDPEVAMGAAWMLDAPQIGFIRRHVRTKEDNDFPGMPASWRRELDEDAIAAMIDEFERLCRHECLAQIERAVRLDDDNVELRRARALLLFQTKFMSLDSEPRQDDWLSVLEACAQADPENALYDYLAALHLWTSSADYDWQEDGYVLNVEDKDQFEQGNARLASGLEKPHLRFGAEGYAATFEFLEASSASPSVYLNAAGSRQINSRATNFLYRIMRWESVQHDVENRAGRSDEAVGAARRVLAISEQVTEAGNSPDLLTSKLILRQWSLANLEGIHEDHPNVLSADEAANVARQLAEVQRELKIFVEVYRRMAARAGTSVSEVSPGTKAKFPQKLLSVLLMTTAQMLVIVCVALALMLSLVSVRFGRSDDADQVRLGWGRHIVAWLLAVGVSFVLLGMFPAEVVSANVQTWLVCGAIWMGFGSVLLGALYLCRRRFLLPVAILMSLLAVPAGTALIMMTQDMEPQAWISPADWKEAQVLHVEADEWQSAMTMDDSKWAWAFVQWQAYHGPLVAPVIAVVILMVWHLILRARRVEGGLRRILRFQKKSELRQSGKSVACSCLVAALIWLALYLGATPPVADMMDTYYRVCHARMARPDKAWEEIAELTVEVKADKQTMARLQAEIDERNRQLAE